MANHSRAASHGDVSHTVEGPSAAQWEDVKSEIRELYMVQRRPLKYVKHRLEQRGFRATERMYKSRLSAWKFSKNSSDKEYQICAVLHKIRRDSGKTHTSFVINDSNIRTMKDLLKYIKGRKMSFNDFYALAANSVTSEQLHDEHQVRALTPVSDAEDGHESDADSDMMDAPAIKPTQSLTGGSSNVAAPEGRTQKRRSSTLASNSSLSTMHHIPQHVPLTNEPAVGTFISQGVVYTPDSDSSSPVTIAFPGAAQSQRTTPRSSFGRGNVEALAYSTVYSPSLPQTYGTDNLEGWTVLSQGASDTSSLSDFDVPCSQCHRNTSEHFSHSCSLEIPQSSAASPNIPRQSTQRDILNPTPDLPSSAEHFAVPASSREQDHAPKWVSHCFSACIYYSRGRYTDSHARNLVENTPSAAADPESFLFARWDLERADCEFRAMILNYDPNILTAILQTVTVLGMHNWHNITKKIMGNAADVAKEMLGADHPIFLVARFATLMSNVHTLYNQREITSATLAGVWQAFVHGYAPQADNISHTDITQTSRMDRKQPPLTIPAEGEAGRRAIPAMYCYISLLVLEATRDEQPYKNMKLEQAEKLLRRCYVLARRTFHPNHMQAIAALVKLQLVLERLGRLADAIEVIEKAVESGRTTLGSRHPRQLESIRINAVLIQKLWKEQGETVAAIYAYNAGNRHDDDQDDLITATRNTGQQVRTRAEDYQKIESILWEVLEGRVSMLGKKHESTMASKLDLMDWMQERGKWGADSLDMQRLNDIWEWTDVNGVVDECCRRSGQGLQCEHGARY